MIRLEKEAARWRPQSQAAFLPETWGTLPVYTAGGQTFPAKGQILHIFGFTGHAALIPATQI